MTRYFFDLESNGLLEEMDTVHSLVLMDADRGTIYSYDRKDCVQGIKRLNEADEIIGHNVINFDVQALKKVYPWFEPAGQVTDTLVLSRLLFPNLADLDKERSTRYRLEGKLIGSHSLKAWGFRVGEYKGDFGETSDWSCWTPEMQRYCEQDVRVTAKLYKRLMREEPSPASVELEHRFAQIIAEQERHGFRFDSDAAVELYQHLVGKRLEISTKLAEVFPPKEVKTVFVPKANNKKRGYVKGVPFTKVEIIPFNPSSRQMIAERLIKKGWKPDKFTDTGLPKVDETILSALPYPEAKVLAEHFLIEKRIGQLAEGDQAWLRLVRQGRIHGSVNTNGAVTGRCTHSRPNVAQVPAVGTPYGSECRSLFCVRPGFSLVGADLSGLELRCLAHFMARYDGGDYARVLLEGDIHTVNQLAAGLPTRNNAKTFIYAFLYGAGDEKIGSIVAPDASPEEKRKIGAKLKRKFLAKTPALKKLKDAVSKAADRGYIIGLDGRHLHIRSQHAALNTLLQSAGALIAKEATVIAYDDLTASGHKWGKDFAFVAHVHDEIQAEVRNGLEETVGKAMVNAMTKAGEFFKFRVRIDGEFKIGSNWKETH